MGIPFSHPRARHPHHRHRAAAGPDLHLSPMPSPCSGRPPPGATNCAAAGPAGRVCRSPPPPAALGPADPVARPRPLQPRRDSCRLQRPQSARRSPLTPTRCPLARTQPHRPAVRDPQQERGPLLGEPEHHHRRRPHRAVCHRAVSVSGVCPLRSHEGERPMAIRWRLERAIPAGGCRGWGWRFSVRSIRSSPTLLAVAEPAPMNSPPAWRARARCGASASVCAASGRLRLMGTGKPATPPETWICGVTPV